MTRSKSRSPRKKSIQKTSLQLTSTGDIIPLNELFEGKPFFRKYFNYSLFDGISVENLIYRMLHMMGDRKHKNIVDVYRVTDEYVDMELVDYVKNRKTLKKVMKDVKSFLQKNNIVYVDWKPDNIGVDQNGQLKLYDFDGSGIFNSDGEWVFEAPDLYAKRNAPKGYAPKEIDDWTFKTYLRTK